MSQPASRSILQDEKECYVCRKKMNTSVRGGLQIHHIYAGKNRRISDHNGFWIWILPYWHNGCNDAVHCKNGSALDLELKQDCQRKYEETHTREEFIQLIGRSYL